MRNLRTDQFEPLFNFPHGRSVILVTTSSRPCTRDQFRMKLHFRAVSDGVCSANLILDLSILRADQFEPLFNFPHGRSGILVIMSSRLCARDEFRMKLHFRVVLDGVCSAHAILDLCVSSLCSRPKGNDRAAVSTMPGRLLLFFLLLFTVVILSISPAFLH